MAVDDVDRDARCASVTTSFRDFHCRRLAQARSLPRSRGTESSRGTNEDKVGEYHDEFRDHRLSRPNRVLLVMVR